MIAVQAIYRDPFTLGSPTVRSYTPGTRLSEIAADMPGVPDGSSARVNGSLIPIPMWEFVKPSAGTDVTFHAPIQGGSDGGKQIGALVATLALTVATAGIAGGTIAGAFTGAAAAGEATILSTALAAGTALAGSLLISAVFQPPVSVSGTPDGFDRDKNGAASVQGNVLEKNGPLPRVIGTRKIFPPLASQPQAYYDGNDEVVEAAFVLAGPHNLADIRLDEALISDAEDIEIQVREGWTDDAPVTFAKKQVVNSTSSVELSAHTVKDDDKQKIESVNDVPVFHPFIAREGADYVNIQIEMPQGLSVNGDDTIDLFVPLRLRMRKKGDVTWINLPEVHFQSPALIQTRTTIRLQFQDGQQTFDPTFGTSGWIEARRSTEDQTVAPAVSGWVADAYFSSGSGSDEEYMNSSVTSTSGVRNVTLANKQVTFHLDRATFVDGEYEVEIKRGAAVRQANYSSSAYTYSGTVLDFFRYRDSGGFQIPMSRSNVIDTIIMVRSASIWEDDPIAQPGFATIAIKARNRNVERLSVVASGYVQDWDGSAWATWTTTSNPAPHYNDVLRGVYNFDPVPDSVVDNDSLVDWRTACASAGHACDFIAEGERLDDLLRIIAGTGFARPYGSDIWGVVRDFDRSAESPVQIFSPRNSAGFKWRKAFSRRATGFRVNFQDADRAAQTIVYLDEADERRIEQIDYQGIKTEAAARSRALYDLGQAKYRAAFFEFMAPTEAIVCRRGSLIGMQHDTIYTHAGSGRIAQVFTSGGNVTGIRLDGNVPVRNTSDFLSITDVLSETDILDVGVETAVTIRNSDGSETTHQVSDATGWTDTLTFTTPVADATTPAGPFDAGPVPLIDVGNLAVVGKHGKSFRRLIVFSIAPKPDHSATIVAVDEAPELWA